MKNSIDINADVGESYGHYQVGQDSALLPYLSSCNIACGFHAGDHMHMHKTVETALRYDVRIGAHPAFPDLRGFGRKPYQLEVGELQSLLCYQIGALQGICHYFNANISYVKPHGALYHAICWDTKLAQEAVEVIQQLDSTLAIMGFADSELQQQCEVKGVAFIREGFIDRQYTSTGRLRARSFSDATIHDPVQAVQHVLRMLEEQEVLAIDTKERIPITSPQSFCIHGDNPQALDILKALHKAIGDKYQIKA